MKIVKKVIKWILYFLLIPFTYIIISLILSLITVDRKANSENLDKLIYLNTNGVHLDIVIPIKNLDSLVLSGIKHHRNEKYLSFGWGDKNFYINTPTWGDLTFSNAFKAMFLKSSTLMHVTRHKQKRSDWIEIKVNKSELQKLNSYLLNTFEVNENGMKIILENKGYSSTDDFYKSKGSYSCFKTCNSWVNTGFKESGLKSCFWTPFDFGLMNKYE
jgi:uncharacterized protein (TIGR02117 family)